MNFFSESDPSEPFKSAILSVLIVLALALVFGIGAITYKCRKRQAGRTMMINLVLFIKYLIFMNNILLIL